MIGERPLLVFINPKSGGGLAGQFMNKIRDLPNIYIVRLPEEAGTWKDQYRELLQDERLRLVAAGGDGTANWVVSLLSEIYPLNTDGLKPPIAICPFGTGNDLSRCLGWGGSLNSHDVNNAVAMIERIRNAIYVTNFDIWNVTISRTDTEQVTSHQMINYFSIGVDAHMSQNFEKCRNCCSCCFCCQCMSKTMYVPVGFGSLCGIPLLKDYLHCQVESEGQATLLKRELDYRCGERTLTVQCITSIYGGRDLWRNNIPRGLDDRHFEVIAQGGPLKLGMTHIGIYLGREICQATSLTAQADDAFFYQVDGEGAICNGPAEVKITRKGSYPFVHAPN